MSDSDGGSNIRGSKAPDGNRIAVRVELISWVNQFVGGSGSGSTEFDEDAAPGATVREVLWALAERYPQLKAALWDENDRTQIGTHVEIIVNDSILGVAHGLDSSLSNGDHIILTGQYVGG